MNPVSAPAASRPGVRYGCLAGAAAVVLAVVVLFYSRHFASILASLGIPQPKVGFRLVALLALSLAIGGIVLVSFVNSNWRRLGTALVRAAIVIDIALVAYFYWVVTNPERYFGPIK